MLIKTVFGSIILFLLPVFFIFPMGHKENELNGNRFYNEGDFERASAEYSEGLTKKADYDLYFNRGISFYKLGRFDKSFSDFEDAATYANSKRNQIKAVYNAGNSNFMMGETVKTENQGEALEFYEKAVKHFERVLELDADNQDASYNLELSRIRLDEIKKQQSEDQQDEDKQSENQADKNEDDGNEHDEGQQDQNQEDMEQQTGDQQTQEDQQNTDNSEGSYLSEEILPKDILNEEARRQEVIITTGSSETVDKDW